MVDLEKIVLKIAGQAKDLLIKDGHHTPLVIAFKNDKQYIVKVPGFDTADEKNEAFAAVIKVLRKLRPTVFVVIIESWVVKARKGYKSGESPPPSEHPDKFEALVITGKSPERTYMIGYPFSRKKKKIIFGEPFMLDTKNKCSTVDDRFSAVFRDVH